MNDVIKFNRPFSKLIVAKHNKPVECSFLIDVFFVKKSDLSNEFIKYDSDESYNLDSEDYLLLLFHNDVYNHTFTTLRKATKENIKYYCYKIGLVFNIVIQQEGIY